MLKEGALACAPRCCEEQAVMRVAEERPALQRLDDLPSKFGTWEGNHLSHHTLALINYQPEDKDR